MGILETWSRERTKRIQARNKRKTAAKRARQEARADVAEATGTRGGQALAGVVTSALGGRGTTPTSGRGGGRGGRGAPASMGPDPLLLAGLGLGLLAVLGSKK